MDSALSRENWAAEENERRKAAMNIARKAKVNLGSRSNAREMFLSIKQFLKDLRSSYDHEMSFETHAEYREPSISNVLSNEFIHPLIESNHSAKRIVKAAWNASNHQYNPENACRDLIDKCILCIDGSLEWPPTCPAPPPPKPNDRVGLLKPILGSHIQELTGLNGSVVDVIRHSINDRFIERSMSKDEKSSSKLIPPEKIPKIKKKLISYAQTINEDSSSDESSSDGDSDDDEEEDENDNDSNDSDSSSHSSGISSINSTQRSENSKSKYQYDIDMNDPNIDSTMVKHATRLILRPRQLREQRAKPHIDDHHSVLGTTALVAACQFEDIPFTPVENDGNNHDDDDNNMIDQQTQSQSLPSDSRHSQQHLNQRILSSTSSVGSKKSIRSRGSKINLLTNQKNIRRSGKSVASTLIALGSDVNLIAEDGMAALHAAASQGNVNTIKRLIQNGAHRGVRDKYGRRADQVIFDELPKEKHAEIMLLLRDLPTSPPPVRLLLALPRSVNLTWNIIPCYPGEYELIAYRLALRITTPQPVSLRYEAAIKSLSHSLVKRTQASDGLIVRAAVAEGFATRKFLLPLKGSHNSLPTLPASLPSTSASSFLNDRQFSSTSSVHGGSPSEPTSPFIDSQHHPSQHSSSSSHHQHQNRHQEANNDSIGGKEGGGGQQTEVQKNDDGLCVIQGAPPVVLPGLVPYTTYGVRLSSESCAGISIPSLETLVFTKGEEPTSCGCAFQVGMTRTSITIMWIPPEFDNGSIVEAYEVRRFLPVPPDENTKLKKGDKPDKYFPELGPSTRYRIDGEENYTQIKFRELYPSARFTIRAKNAIGWSPFSVLSPVMKAGDSIRVVELGGTFIKVEWDTPPGLNILRFGMQKRFYTLILKEDQYHEIDDDIIPKLDGTPVQYTITGLKPGSKHQIRIRSSDASGWRPWKTSLVSEVLVCACDVAFPPTQPQVQLFYSGGKPPTNENENENDDNESNGGDGGKGSVDNENNNEASDDTKKQVVPREYPSISLSWKPGDSNGSPIEEYEISWSNGRRKPGGSSSISLHSENSNSNNNNNNNNSSSREQPYEDELENNHHENGDGVIRGGVRDLDDEISLITNSDDMVNNPPSSSSSSIITHQNDENNNDHNDDDDDVYKWHVMTTIKATKYLADEVILGGSYIFRIRARNSLGWSKYGPSSKPIIVFRVLPPLPPSQLINEKSGKLCSPGVTFLKLSWKPPPGKPASEIDSYEMEFCDEKSGGGDGLSAPSSSSSSSNGIDNNDNDDDGGGGGRWSAISIIGGPTTIKGAGIEKPNIILQGLLPGHKYTFRIRALAFEGWTDWSIASDVMSTDRRF